MGAHPYGEYAEAGITPSFASYLDIGRQFADLKSLVATGSLPEHPPEVIDRLIAAAFWFKTLTWPDDAQPVVFDDSEAPSDFEALEDKSYDEVEEILREGHHDKWTNDDALQAVDEPSRDWSEDAPEVQPD